MAFTMCQAQASLGVMRVLGAIWILGSCKSRVGMETHLRTAVTGAIVPASKMKFVSLMPCKLCGMRPLLQSAIPGRSIARVQAVSSWTAVPLKIIITRHAGLSMTVTH